MKQRQQICDLLIAGKRWTAAALIKTDELATVERYKGKTSEVSAVNLNSIRTNVLLHSGKSFMMKRREKREEKIKDKGKMGRWCYDIIWRKRATRFGEGAAQGCRAKVPYYGTTVRAKVRNLHYAFP